MDSLLLHLTALALASVALCLSGCSEQQPESHIDASAQKAFWQWFKENGNRVAEEIQSRDRARLEVMLDNVNRRLHACNPGLRFVFGKREDVFEFVVTADGRKEYFEVVKEFVRTSPPIEGWELIAFRPPSPAPKGVKIRLEGVELSATGVQFQAFDLGAGALGITLYISGLTDQDYDKVGAAAVALLDHVVGEYDAVTKIDSLVLKSLHEAEPGAPLQSLSDLPEFLNKRR